jgi:putative flippase GtrA
MPPVVRSLCAVDAAASGVIVASWIVVRQLVPAGCSLGAHGQATCRWQRDCVDVESRSSGVWPVERFHILCEQAVALLPFGLDSVVAPTFLGFVLINGGTFGIDLLLLAPLHGGLGVPLPIAVTVAYVCAFALSYVLNRVLNFRSHGAVGPQVAVYVVVIAVNYLAFILGLSSVLAMLGVQYHAARIVAGISEAVYMYSAMRWVVFRR